MQTIGQILLKSKLFNHSKWLATGCYVLATISMINPDVASTSIAPWVLYLIGNVIWLIDSIITKNTPWVWLGSFFTVYDVLLILSRIYPTIFASIYAWLS